MHDDLSWLCNLSFMSIILVLKFVTVTCRLDFVVICVFELVYGLLYL
jgi:hypothetical protein